MEYIQVTDFLREPVPHIPYSKDPHQPIGWRTPTWGHHGDLHRQLSWLVEVASCSAISLSISHAKSMLGSDAWQLEQGLRMQDSHEHLHALTCFFFQILHPPFRIIIHFESLTNVSGFPPKSAWTSCCLQDSLEPCTLDHWFTQQIPMNYVWTTYELRMNYVATADMLLAKAAQRLQNVSADNAWQILADPGRSWQIAHKDIPKKVNKARAALGCGLRWNVQEGRGWWMAGARFMKNLQNLHAIPCP